MSSTGADPGAVAAAMEVLVPLGGRAELGGALGTRTTYRVGGPGAVVVVPATLADLALVAAAHRVSGLPLLAVGRGSNLLIADRGFDGIAVILDPGDDAFGWVDLAGGRARAGAAAPLPTLARRSVDAGLAGFEWAVGVPGSLGGAVRMNAGGHGSDMARSVASVTVADLDAEPHSGDRPRLATWYPEQLAYSYRRSALGPAHLVIDADLALKPGDPVAGRETIRAIVQWRREHQPGGQNAGSVFTNPSDAGRDAAPVRSAGALLEAAGLKGLRLGSAEVSTKHANFIQADPGGSADDVNALVYLVRDVVKGRFGVVLDTEIRRIGSFSQPQQEG